MCSSLSTSLSLESSIIVVVKYRSLNMCMQTLLSFSELRHIETPPVDCLKSHVL